MYEIDGKPVRRPRALLPALAGSWLLAMTLVGAAAEPNSEPAGQDKPMALQEVMKALGQTLQAVTGAIAVEDWEQVAGLAPKIAHHDEPPLSEKVRILAWLGADAGAFRAFDDRVAVAATRMGEAAAQGDGQAVITAFADVQQGCLACHSGFRKHFIEHFHHKR